MKRNSIGDKAQHHVGEPIMNAAALRPIRPKFFSFAQTFTWGCPNDHALGISGTRQNQAEARPRAPKELLSSEIQQAAAGQGHTLWLDASGRVWASGRNNEGQCGVGRSMVKVDTPRVVAALDSMYVTHIAAGALTSACIVDGKLYEVSAVQLAPLCSQPCACCR